MPVHTAILNAHPSLLAPLLLEHLLHALHPHPTRHRATLHRIIKVCYHIIVLFQNTLMRLFRLNILQTPKIRIKNFARSRKAALRNLIGFGGVKLFLLKHIEFVSFVTI